MSVLDMVESDLEDANNKIENLEKELKIAKRQGAVKELERLERLIDGAVKELERLERLIDGDRRNNRVWYEGEQYFETVLDYVEERLKELEGARK